MSMAKKNDFFKIWEKQLNDVRLLLKYLHTYPIILEELRINNLISPESLIQSQLDWINLYDKYDGLEKEFFKKHWVPIQIDQYDYFIDMSDPNYPILNYYYKSTLPYKYTRKNLFDSINDLLLLDHENSNLIYHSWEHGFELICKGMK